MVHPQVQPLLALGLVGLERAKMLFVARLVAHSTALALAVVAAVAGDYHNTSLEIGAAAVAIVSEFAALLFHHRALELHSRGRQVMRRVMLLDALNPGGVPVVLDEMRMHFSEPIRRKAMALEERDRLRGEDVRRLGHYYWSTKGPGPTRLRDHLFESALFTHHLYLAAWKVSMACMGGLLLAAGVVLVFLLSHHGGSPAAGSATAEHGGGTLVLRIVIALVAFLPACQELDHLLLYKMAAHHLGDLLRRVETLYTSPLPAGGADPRLLAEFGDYCAATTFAPPIRTLVFKAIDERLNQEFKAKMKELGQEASSV